MNYSQEYIAENLFEALNEHFESNKVIKKGVGVHWHCSLESGNRRSKIHCFEHRHYKDVKPEYLISFEESEENKAWGRTFDINEVIQSSRDWINEKELVFLYQKYEFIDWYKRKIESIEEHLIAYESGLEKTEREIDSTWGSGIYDYRISYKNRSCDLTGFGKNNPIGFAFKWDDCVLFEVIQSDLRLLAAVIKKWLIDEIEPSALDRQYDWLKTGNLAKYYEQGEGITGEFIESWNFIERFFGDTSDSWSPFKTDALKLIHEMRSIGLDKQLRAGQSLFFFLLSRARRHSLDENHPFLHITFLGKNRMKVHSSLNGVEDTIETEVKYSSHFKLLVEQLLLQEIE